MEEHTAITKSFILRSFPESSLLERSGLMWKFSIPGTQADMAYIFKVIADNKDAANIDDYSLTQSTLEQIFNKFAKMQELPQIMPN